MQNNKRFETAEFVLPGHPDKICDAVVDSIVGLVTREDELAQCGLEAACVFDRIFLTGRIALDRSDLVSMESSIHSKVREVYRSAGYGEDAAGHLWGPAPENIRIDTAFNIGKFDEGEAELRYLSDDQAICIGYACSLEETSHLPPAQWLARRIGQELHRLRKIKGAGQVGPDAKVIVRVARTENRWQPERVSISLNHHEGSDWLFLRKFAEEALETACIGLLTPQLEINGAGLFICGGPNGDNGLSGKKLVVDAYGPTVPIGGGAWSGKDFRKVDRLGGLLARQLALKVQKQTGCDEAVTTLEYHPGCEGPVSITIEADHYFLDPAILGVSTGYLSNIEVWKRYKKCHLKGSLEEIARWGHLGHSDYPWANS